MNLQYSTMDASFYGDRISDNLIETPEGYLVCKDVKIARIGVQKYLGQELGEKDRAYQMINVHRLPEDVFDKDTLNSFEGKPVSDDHPRDGVSLDNFTSHYKGHAQNVRRDGDYIIADLVITDSVLMNKIKNNLKREVSCGYNCDYVPYKDGYKQIAIRGNHIAVVERGRAGSNVRINDSKKDIPMNKNQALLKLITAYAKDNAVEDVEAIAALVLDTKKEDDLFTRLSKFMSKDKKDEATEEAEEETKKEKRAEDEAEEEEKKKTEDRLARIETLLSHLVKDEDEEEKKTEDESEEMMDEAEEEEKKKTEDSLTKKLLPLIAKLPAKDQKAFKDALRGTKDSKAYAKISDASKSHAKKHVQQQDAHYDLGAKIAAKYNPHYKESK